MLMAIILLAAVTFASLAISGLAIVSVRRCHREGRENISRAARAISRLKARSGKRVSREFRLFTKAIEETLAKEAQKAVEGQTPAILAKLQGEQKKALDAMREFLSRETARQEKLRELRLEGIEKDMEGVAAKTTGLMARIKGLFHRPNGGSASANPAEESAG